MKIQARYFASVREALGSGEDVDVAAGSDVAGLRDALIGRGGRYAEVLDRRRTVRAAVNRVLRAESAALAEGDEVAFFPPVTGG